MWVNTISALFIQCMAFIALFLLGFTQISAAEEPVAYQVHLTALTDDPAFQEYLRNLKRTAAEASAQPVTQPEPNPKPSTHQPRIIEISDDAEESTATPNTTQRFIFTSAAAKPVQVNKPSASEAASLNKHSQIEQLRQRAAGSNAQ